jgi:hypothetical protein
MKKNSGTTQEIPLDIVGSSTFGRDPKVMASRTFNMIVADDFLVDCYGYKNVLNVGGKGRGRAIFSSIKANKLILVISNKVYTVGVYVSPLNGSRTYDVSFIATIESFSGDVFIDENAVGQVAICDQHNIYIYNHISGSFAAATLPEGFSPGYVCYQNGRFVSPDKNSNLWILSAVGNGLDWFWGSSGETVEGALQTKPDFAIATIRMPSRGNLLLVMGRTVTELWSDIGAPGFPYQKSYTANIDYGCVNPATIAASDSIVCWLGSNEKSGPVIMYTTGGDIKQISTDGINFKFGQLNFPEQSTGFFVKLAGHLLYQLTFYNKADNYSLIYDFTTQMFFDVTDEDQNYHIARSVALFNGEYYFVSFTDGNLYQMSDDFYTYDYGKFSDGSEKIYEIPRIRICKNIRAANSFRFVSNNITATIEQGNDSFNTGNNPAYNPRLGLSLSKNGGVSFGGYQTRPIYKIGNRMNRLNWWGQGISNDLVPQFRFWGKGPWKITNGLVSIYQ